MAFSSERPSKVLACQATTSVPGVAWPYDDGTGEKWWAGGTDPKPYKWVIDLTVTAQAHGSQLTREPYSYDGLDVKVGDWIADTNSGLALRIVSILEKASLALKIEVEDIDRYNTFQSPLGNGVFSIPGSCVVFEIGEEDLPVLNPLPPQVTQVNFVTQVNARFTASNPMYAFRIVQANSFDRNDTLWVNPVSGLFEIATGTDTKSMVGTVHRTILPDIFYFIPTTKIIEDILPILPGDAGSVIYVDDSTGELTTSAGTNNKKAYIQLTDAISDIIRGSVSNPTTTIGYELSINGTDVTFSGTTLTSAVSDINLLTGSHNVTASEPLLVNTAVTSAPNLVYGIVGAQGTGTQASINGTTVTFSITTSGLATGLGPGIADSRDMAEAINLASISNVVADGSTGGTGGTLTITNTSGAAITIVNITADSGPNNFAGPTSCSGVPLVTAAQTAKVLKLENPNGFGIELYDTTGTPRADFGIHSVANGAVPLGLVVEQSIRQGATYVVPDITSRDALAPIVGDQSYVIDADDGAGSSVGEWAYYLWDGTAWVKLSDYDSARTDSNSASAAIVFGSGASTDIETISSGTRVTLITVEVTVPFDGTPTLSIEDSNNGNIVLMGDAVIDLATIGTYAVPTNHLYTGMDTDIVALYTTGAATTGAANVIISYQ